MVKNHMWVKVANPGTITFYHIISYHIIPYPLRKPNGHKGIIVIKRRPKRAYDYVGLLYSFVVLLHDICVLPGPM